MDRSINLADWHYIGVEMTNAATQTASVAVDATEKTAEETVTAVVAEGGSAAAAAAAGAAVGSGAGFTILVVGAAAGMGGLVAGMLLMRWRDKAGIAPVQVAPIVEKKPDMPAACAPLADVQQDAPVESIPVTGVQQEVIASAIPALLPAPQNDAQPVKLIDTPLELSAPVEQASVAEVVRPPEPPPPEPTILLHNGLPVMEGVLTTPALPCLPPAPEPAAVQSVLVKPALPPPEPPAPPHMPSPAPASFALIMDSAPTSEKYRVRDYAIPLLAVSVMASSAVLGRALWRCTATKRPPIRVPVQAVKPTKSREVVADLASNTSRYRAPSAWPVFERAPLHNTSAWVSSKCAVPNMRTSAAHGCWPQTSAFPEAAAISVPDRPPPTALASVDVEMSVMSTALAGRLGPTGRRANVRVVGGVVRPAAATSSRVFRILPGQ